MGFGLGFGAFVSGATEGYDRSRARTRADEQDSWLREDHDEKIRLRDETKNFAIDMESLQKNRANGGLPGKDGLTEEGKALIAQDNASYDRAETSRLNQIPNPTAIAAPTDSAPAAGAQPQAEAPSLSRTNRQNDIFKSGGEGLYVNQKSADDAYYSAIEARTAKHLYATGQGDKVLALSKQINDMREQGYEPLRKAAAAALAIGAPNAMSLVAKASEISGYGSNIDPTSGTYDQKTQTYKGVSVTDAEGKVTKKDLSMTDLLVGLNQLTPVAAVAAKFARQDKEFDQGIEERKTASGESTARSNAATARATVDLKGIAAKNQTLALEDRRAQKEDDVAFKRERQFTSELESDLFRGKDPSMMDDTQREKLTRTASLARNLYAIPGNESLNAATLAGVSRGLGTGKARVTELPASYSEAQRKSYLQADYAGATVLIPRSLIQQATK